MTSGGAMGGQADVLYIDVEGRGFEEFENKLNRLEDNAGDAGERTGSRLSGAFALGTKVAVGAAGALGLAVAGAVPAMKELAQEADAARATNEMFAKTLERMKVPAGDAQAAISDLSSKLGVAPEIIKEGMTTIFRAGGTLEDAVKTITAAGASAAASGGDIANAVSNSSAAIAMGRSELLESAGIMTNASDAYEAYAKKIGVSTKALTEQQKIQAFSNAVFEESKYEIADLDTIMGGLVGQQAKAAQASREMRNAIGQALLPIVQSLGVVSTNVTFAVTKFVQGLDKEQVAAFGKNIQNVAMAFGSSLGTALNIAVPIVQKFAGIAFDLAGKVLPPVGEALKSLGSVVIPLIVSGFKTAGVIVASAAENFQKPSAFVERNKEVFIALGSGIGVVVSALAIHRAATIAATAITTAWTAVTATATTVVGGLRVAIALLTGPVGLAVAAITALVAAGVYLYRNWDTVKAKALEVWNGLKAIIQNAMNSVTQYLKGIDLKEVGLDIVRGLANGILAGPRLVLKAAEGLGSAVLKGVKGILKIQSPSREMEEVGHWAGIGLQVGLQKTAPAVQQAAAHLGSKVRQGVVDALAGGLVEIQDAAKQVDVVRDLFGNGEKGLASALAYFGVRTFEELADKAPTAARLVEAAYRSIIQAQEAAAQAQREHTEALEEGERAGINALNALDNLHLGGRELAGQAEKLPDTTRNYTDLYERLGELASDLDNPGVADAWNAAIEDMGRRSLITADQVEQLKTRIQDLQTIPHETLGPDNLQGRGILSGTVLSLDDPATGALGPDESQDLLAAMVGMDPEELGGILADLVAKGFGSSDLAALIRTHLKDAAAALQTEQDEITASLIENGGVTLNPDTGEALYQTEEQVRGIGVAAEEAEPAVFDLANALANLGQFATLAELDSFIDQAQLAEEDAAALRDEFLRQTAALQDLIVGYDDAGKAIYQTEDQLRGVGVASEEATESFFDMGNSIKNVAGLSREELEALIVTAQLTTEQADELRRAWTDVQLNVTVQVFGVETGIKQLDLYKSAIQGVADAISGTFEAIVSGTEAGVDSILKNMAKMALGIVKQVAVAIVAYQAQAIALAIISGATFNFVRAGLALAAAAAVAGIAAGLEARLGQRSGAPAPSSSAGGAASSGVAASTRNDLVNVPTSQVTVMATPEWVGTITKAADKMLQAGELQLAAVREGVRVTVDNPVQAAARNLTDTLLRIHTP